MNTEDRTKYTADELNVVSAYRAYVTARYQVMEAVRNFEHTFSFIEDKKRMRRLLRQSAKAADTSDFLEALLKEVE